MFYCAAESGKSKNKCVFVCLLFKCRQNVTFDLENYVFPLHNRLELLSKADLRTLRLFSKQTMKGPSPKEWNQSYCGLWVPPPRGSRPRTTDGSWTWVWWESGIINWGTSNTIKKEHLWQNCFLTSIKPNLVARITDEI